MVVPSQSLLGHPAKVSNTPDGTLEATILPSGPKAIALMLVELCCHEIFRVIEVIVPSSTMK